MTWSRRDFLRLVRRTMLGSAGLGIAGLGYGHYLEPSWLEIVREVIVLRQLPDAFAGFKIAQISDLHFGPWTGPDDITPAIQAIDRLQPDAIVITGDIVTRITHGELDMIVQSLSALRAPAGVFAVLGNHDWWVGGPEVAAAMERAGVIVLRNSNINWQRGGQRLHLAGVDDVWRHQQDLDNALTGLTAQDATIVIVHEPDFADEVARDGRTLFQISGHSHGGQIRLPGYGGLQFPPWGEKYTLGRYQVGKMTLYTNRGLGMVKVPFRFCCRPEVTLFTLRPE